MQGRSMPTSARPSIRRDASDRHTSTVDRLHVTAPASSANLGPGYDCLGVALPLRNDVVVERSSGPLEVVLLGDGAGQLPSDATNLVVQSFRRSSGLTGDGLRFTLENRVPLRSGTGSSSAAIVAGLAAGLAFTGRAIDVETLLPLAIEIEGHPDNVAAAILGGFTIALGGDPPLARRIAPPAGLGFVLVVPTDTLCTQESRKALRPEIPRADAVYSLQRSALLVDLLATGALELLPRALSDRMHEPDRAVLTPMLGQLRALDRNLPCFGVTLSGAGPSVLVWVREDGTQAAASAIRAEVPDAQVIAMLPDAEGVRVERS
jgi:homoserine kinase